MALSADDPLHRNTSSLFVEAAESSEHSTVTGDKPRDAARLRMTGLRRLTTKASLLAVQKVPKYGVEPTNRDALEEVSPCLTARIERHDFKCILAPGTNVARAPVDIN